VPLYVAVTAAAGEALVQLSVPVENVSCSSPSGAKVVGSSLKVPAVVTVVDAVAECEAPPTLAR
jgi:hypothetical protein